MNYNIKKNYLMNVVAVTILSFLFFSIRPAYAQEQYVDYIYLNDGSKIKVITIIEENTSGITLFTTTKTKNVTKLFERSNDKNVVCGLMILTGTFQYNGSTSKATKVSMTVSGKNNWYCISKKSSKSGASVYGYAAFKNGSSLTSIEGKITCTKNGTIK